MLPWILGIIFLFIKLVIVLVVLLLVAAYLVLAERKLLARFQVRFGPNRAGRYGWLQPLADTIKMLAKEDIVPEAVDRIYFSPRPGRGSDYDLAHLRGRPFCRHPDHWRQVHPDGGHGFQCRLALCLCARFHRSLRSRPGRLGFQLQIQPPGRHSRGGPDDQLRTAPGPLAGPRGHAGRFLQPGRYRQRPEPAILSSWCSRSPS